MILTILLIAKPTRQPVLDVVQFGVLALANAVQFNETVPPHLTYGLQLTSLAI